MKKIFAALLLAVPLLAAAQPPDFDTIRERVAVRDSEYYYPVLFNRYLLGDTTLTRDHYRHIYYGFVGQLQYRPFDPPEVTEEMYLFSREKERSKEDYLSLAASLTGLMMREPFNMSNLNLMTYAYGMAGDADNEYKSALRLDMLLQTIFSSGDGKDEKNPWHVIYMDNITGVMTLLGNPYEPKPVIISLECLYMRLLRRTDGVRGHYFNFASVYLRPPDPLDKKSRGWEFNGIKIR